MAELLLTETLLLARESLGTTRALELTERALSKSSLQGRVEMDHQGVPIVRLKAIGILSMPPESQDVVREGDNVMVETVLSPSLTLARTPCIHKVVGYRPESGEDWETSVSRRFGRRAATGGRCSAKKAATPRKWG